jgi:hypothetical protein
MKRMVIAICVLFLMFDMPDDGCLGKAKFFITKPPAKTSFTSSNHLNSSQTDSQDAIAATDLLAIPRHGQSQPLTLCVLSTIQIIHRCHLGSSGGIPL